MTAAAILDIVRQSGGFLTSRQADTHGISHSMLSYLVARNRLARSDRGVYTLPETMDDGFLNVGNRYRRGVFSHGCALYLFGLTDRTPNEMEMTFPRSSNVSAASRAGVHCHRVADSIFELGKTSVKTPCGNIVTAYSPERTVCDVFKTAKSAPSDEEINALKLVLKRNPAHANAIFAMARLLKIDRLLRPYLESLT